MEAQRTYDLNISENYVPGWGAWEVGREVISNAIDADRSGYKVETLGPDHIRVTTRTAPTLAQIKFIGGGTKSPGGQTIGCFGEGIKLAAMVAKRLGGEMAIRFGTYKVRYELAHDDELGHRSVFMAVEPAELVEGMAIDVMVEGIEMAVAGKFLKSAEPGMVEKQDPERFVLYNKGVFVAESPVKSLFDWNLSTSVNRDRNVVDAWETGSSITALLDQKMDLEFAKALMDAPATMFEVECLRKHGGIWIEGRAARFFLEAFKDKHGADAVMSCDDMKANQLARRKGHKIVLLDETFSKIIKKIDASERVASSDEVVSNQEKLEMAATGSYDLADINDVMDLLDVSAEIFIFQSAKNELGLADFKNGRRRVYLSSSLFEPGMRTQRLGTLVHELAHLSSKAGDASISFEDALTRMAGILAKEASGK